MRIKVVECMLDGLMMEKVIERKELEQWWRLQGHRMLVDPQITLNRYWEMFTDCGGILY